MMHIFKLIPHTADLKIEVIGKSMAELYKNAVIGMFQAIGPHAPGCHKQEDLLVCPHLPQTREIMLTAGDKESLMVDFLSEALYYSDIYNEAYLDAIILEITNESIHAQLKGIIVSSFDVVEIKAVTYHDLEIKEKNGIWHAIIVFDI